MNINNWDSETTEIEEEDGGNKRSKNVLKPKKVQLKVCKYIFDIVNENSSI